MPRAQSSFEAIQFVDDLDCDISDESRGILDLALNIRRKFGVIVRQAQQWKTELLTKQEEIVDLNTRHQQELSRLQRYTETIRDKLRRQNNNLRQYQKDNRLLRLRNQELSNDLEAKREKLEQISRLKGVTTLLATAKRPALRVGGSSKRMTFRKIYLEPDSTPPAAPGDDDKATEVLSIDSSSE
nr:hypothetical protein LTR18_009733 [Exophiala xenobiotica]